MLCAFRDQLVNSRRPKIDSNINNIYICLELMLAVQNRMELVVIIGALRRLHLDLSCIQR